MQMDVIRLNIDVDTLIIHQNFKIIILWKGSDPPRGQHVRGAEERGTVPHTNLCRL